MAETSFRNARLVLDDEVPDRRGGVLGEAVRVGECERGSAADVGGEGSVGDHHRTLLKERRRLRTQVGE